MIIILGFDELDINELPLPKVMNYKKFKDTQEKIAIKLATDKNCISIFIHKKLEGTINTIGIEKPIYYVETKQSIISIINNGENTEDVDTTKETEPKKEVQEDTTHTEKLVITDEEDISFEDEEDDDLDIDLEEIERQLQEEEREKQARQEQQSNEDEDTVLELNKEPETNPTGNPLQWVDDKGNEIQIGVEAQKTVATTEYRELESRIKELEYQKEEQDTKIKALESENLTLVSQLTVKTDSENRLRGTISSLERDITEISRKLDNTLNIADNRLKQQQQTHNEKIKIANETIQEYASKIASYKVSEETKACEPFSSYAVSPKAVVRVPFKESEKIVIGTLKDNIQLVTYKGTDSLQILQDEVYKLLGSKAKCLIVDFTGDLYLSSKYKLKHKASCLDTEKFLTKDIVDRYGDNTYFIGTTTFNDISLLTLKWEVILSNLMSFASNLPILILLGDIDTFATRYIISKIGTEVAKTSIILNATPRNLMNVQMSNMYLPDVKKKLFIMNYKDTFRTITEQLRNNYEVHPCATQIEWGKMFN